MNWIEWRGGECPVTAETRVDVLFRSDVRRNGARAAELLWGWLNGAHSGEIVAYKLSEEQPEIHPQILMPAAAFLRQAAKHMDDRASTYDKPDGERSMAQTISIFNLYHGTNMSEAQGWHFMQILKDVRLFTRKEFHKDSAEDAIAYAALKAEAHQRKDVVK